MVRNALHGFTETPASVLIVPSTLIESGKEFLVTSDCYAPTTVVTDCAISQSLANCMSRQLGITFFLYIMVALEFPSLFPTWRGPSKRYVKNKIC